MNKSFFTATLLSSLLGFAQQSQQTSDYNQIKHNTSHSLHAEDRLRLFRAVPGEFTGDLGFFGDTWSNTADGAANDFMSLYFAPHYELELGGGFAFETGGIFTYDLKDNGGFDEIIADKSVLSELAISYSFSETTIKAGRQSLEFIILEDYFDGITVYSDEFDGLSLRGAWVNKGATLDPDDLTKFEEEYFGLDSGNKDGVYAFEADYQLTEDLTLSGSVAYANNYFTQYGSRVVWETGMNALTVELFNVENYQEDVKDGYLFHVDDTLSFDHFTISAGYIQTSEDAGVGGLLNNFYDPFAEDTIEEFLNVQAWYLTSTISLSDDTEFTVTYGDKYADIDDEGTIITDEKIREFDLILTHNFSDSFSSEFAFVNYDSDKDDSWSRFYANVVYSF